MPLTEKDLALYEELYCAHPTVSMFIDEVRRLRELLGRIASLTDGHYDDGGEINPIIDKVNDLACLALYPDSPASKEINRRETESRTR